MAGSARWDSIDAILSKISKMQALTEKLKTDVEKFESGVEKLQASSERLVEVGLEKMRSALRQSADELKQWREEIEVEAPIEVQSQGFDSNQQIAEDFREQERGCESSKSIFSISEEIETPIKELIEVVDSRPLISEVFNEQGKQSLDLSMVDEPNGEFAVNLIPLKKVFERIGVDNLDKNPGFPGVLMLTDGAFEHVFGFSKNSRDCLKFFVAHKVFDKMTNEDFIAWDIVSMNSNLDFTVFDPGGGKHSRELYQIKCCLRQGEVGAQKFYPGGCMEGLDCKIGDDRISNLCGLTDSFDDIAVSSVLRGDSSVIDIVLLGLKFVIDLPISMPFDRGRVGMSGLTTMADKSSSSRVHGMTIVVELRKLESIQYGHTKNG